MKMHLDVLQTLPKTNLPINQEVLILLTFYLLLKEVFFSIVFGDLFINHLRCRLFFTILTFCRFIVTSNENVNMHSGRHCSKIVKASVRTSGRRGNSLIRNSGSKSQKQWWMVDLMEELPIAFINITFGIDEPMVNR